MATTEPELLKMLGLSRREFELYVWLLKNPGASASRMAELSGIQRPDCHSLLRSLLAKGLASYSAKGKVRYYSPARPSIMTEIFGNRLEEFSSLSAGLSKVVSDLSKIKPLSAKQPSVRTFYGLKGMRSVLMEALEETRKSKKEMLAIRLNNENLPNLDKTYTSRFFNFRKKFKLRSRYLMLQKTRFFDSDLVSKRVLPDKYRSKVGIYVYGNTITFWFFPERELILAIDDEALCDAYRSMFELMWLAAK